MQQPWHWYERCLAAHPFWTEVVSSGVLWALGDIAAQAVTHFCAADSPASKKEKSFKLDWRRVIITSLFAFVFVGPVGHYWYEFLDRFIRERLHLRPGSLRFVVTKVAADGLIFGPLDLFLFFSYMGLASGRRLDEVMGDLKRDFLPAFCLGGAVWPAVQAANFRFVPVRYQLLYVNLFCLLDGCFLSWFEQQGDAQWKHRFMSCVERVRDAGPWKRWLPHSRGAGEDPKEQVQLVRGGKDEEEAPALV